MEITSINESYLKDGQLKVQILGRGFVWFDCGTFDSLLEANMFVKSVEQTHEYKVACIEEISYKNGWISKRELINLAKSIKNNTYSEYIYKIAEEVI